MELSLSLSSEEKSRGDSIKGQRMLEDFRNHLVERTPT